MTSVPHLCAEDVDRFIEHYFPQTGPTLFIGNVGFSREVLHFPRLLGPLANVDLRFMHEVRPGVPEQLDTVASSRAAQLRALAPSRFAVQDIAILADDGAPCGGRNACRQVKAWLEARPYTDVVVDATGMSRSTAFPVVKLLHLLSRERDLRVHLVIADSDGPMGVVKSVSNDRADWMHGFASTAEIDDGVDALSLWVVQLSEGAGAQLQTMFKQLGTPEEVCPVLPFPSARPRRADELLFEHREYWQRDWLETPLSFIRAHESDPMDVFRSICRLHEARREALMGPGLASQTVLSPVGRRLPGIGMLLAALSYELPIFFMETVGYHLSGPLDVSDSGFPNHRWHFRVDKLLASGSGHS